MRPTPFTLAQSKERKGTNFAVWQPCTGEGNQISIILDECFDDDLVTRYMNTKAMKTIDYALMGAEVVARSGWAINLVGEVAEASVGNTTIAKAVSANGAVAAVTFGVQWASYHVLWMKGKISTRVYTKRVLTSFVASAGGFFGSWAGSAIGMLVASSAAGVAVGGPIAAVVGLLFGLGASWASKKAAEKLADSDFAKPFFDWIEKTFDGEGSNSKCLSHTSYSFNNSFQKG